MSDVQPDTPEQRAAEWTRPPQAAIIPAPSGQLLVADVYRDGRYVGAVWITEDKAARPRAGIILAFGTDPDVPFQDDLGDVTLAAASTDWDAAEWIDFVAETRNGETDWKLMVGNVRRSSLIAAQRTAGWPV